MNALIVSDGLDDWVSRYFLEYSVLSLPLAGKPLVEHQLDRCAREGVENVIILDAAYDRRLAPELGDGSRWGLKLSYERAPGGVSEDELVGHYKEFLNGGADGGQSLVIHGAELVYKGEIVRIRSLRDYFDFSLRLVSNPAECVLPGYSSDHGVLLGMNVQLRMGCVVTPPILLDDNVLVDYECHLNGFVIVGEGCILDRRSHLHRAIVFPRTYIARGVDLMNKIVVGSRIIDPITGACVNLADDVLSADLRGRRKWLPVRFYHLFRTLRRIFRRT